MCSIISEMTIWFCFAVFPVTSTLLNDFKTFALKLFMHKIKKIYCQVFGAISHRLPNTYLQCLIIVPFWMTAELLLEGHIRNIKVKYDNTRLLTDIILLISMNAWKSKKITSTLKCGFLAGIIIKSQVLHHQLKWLITLVA